MKCEGGKLDELLATIESAVKESDPDGEELSRYVNLALATRESLRRDKEYRQADEIRNRLTSCGFDVKDTATSPTWVYQPKAKD